MAEAVALMGPMADHLIQSCPALVRSKRAESDTFWRAKYGSELIGIVDVDGPYLCGWCVRVWKARNG
jgi:hypothetical protein